MAPHVKSDNYQHVTITRKWCDRQMDGQQVFATLPRLQCFRLQSTFLCFTILSIPGRALSDSHFHSGEVVCNASIFH